MDQRPHYVHFSLSIPMYAQARGPILFFILTMPSQPADEANSAYQDMVYHTPSRGGVT